jgi:transposase
VLAWFLIMSQGPRPSYEDLEALAERLAALVAELEAQDGVKAGRIAELEMLTGSQAERIDTLEVLVGTLVAENQELVRRLGADSSNSSRPPSSDSPYDKPKPKPSGLRGRSGRRPGKQPGVKGHRDLPVGGQLISLRVDG